MTEVIIGIKDSYNAVKQELFIIRQNQVSEKKMIEVEKTVNEMFLLVKKKYHLELKQGINQPKVCQPKPLIPRKKASDLFKADTRNKINVAGDVPSKKIEKKNETAEEISNEKSHKNLLWIGTSISKALDKNKFEKDTNTNVKFVKAFGIKEEKSHFYPNLM